MYKGCSETDLGYENLHCPRQSVAENANDSSFDVSCTSMRIVALVAVPTIAWREHDENKMGFLESRLPSLRRLLLYKACEISAMD